MLRSVPIMAQPSTELVPATLVMHSMGGEGAESSEEVYRAAGVLCVEHSIEHDGVCASSQSYVCATTILL